MGGRARAQKRGGIDGRWGGTHWTALVAPSLVGLSPCGGRTGRPCREAARPIDARTKKQRAARLVYPSAALLAGFHHHFFWRNPLGAQIVSPVLPGLPEALLFISGSSRQPDHFWAAGPKTGRTRPAPPILVSPRMNRYNMARNPGP